MVTSQLPIIDQKAKSYFQRPLFLPSLVLCFLILAMEFLYDLNQEIFLHKIVITLDIALLVVFFLMICEKIYLHKGSILDLMAHHKFDVVLVILISSTLLFPRLSASLVILRLIVGMMMLILDSNFGTKLLASLNFRPSQTLALSFVGLIAIGTLLLTFPAATTNGKGASLLDAVFTITSSACVAGLVIFDVGLDFTRFGQTVILFCIQAGGLGIMVISAAFAVLVGGNIPARSQAGLREVLDVTNPEGLKTLIRAVTITTIVTEAFGALALFLLVYNEIPAPAERLWWSIFHAVSAFCNCGISFYKVSLVAFANDIPTCFVFMILITIGGIGFFVMADLGDPQVWEIRKPRAIWKRLQIQTKVVLIATVILDVLGMLLFLYFEYDGVLRGLPTDSKIVASLFHAVSLRSAGFNVVPLGNLLGPTIVFSVAFMFIGASPGSTGGGIKTTTAAVSIMALKAMLRGRSEVELLGRRMPGSIVSRSLSIVLTATLIVAVFLMVLLATQEIAFEKLMFEVISAFGTVGLSLDATDLLDDMGKIFIVMVMYVGRIGPLTLALAIGERRVSQRYKLPKGRIAVG